MTSPKRSELKALDAGRVSLTVLIRFANSLATLPAVLDSLRVQTRFPDRILGVDNRSGDGSRAMLEAIGAKIVEWPRRYHHAKVLNFAFKRCQTDLVLVLSSHTVLENPDTIQRLIDAVSQPQTAAASLSCANDSFGLLKESVSWEDLVKHGLPFASIFTNSCGMLRHSCWRETAFNEALDIAEDYAWALWQLSCGRRIARVNLPFRYLRRGKTRYYACARHAIALASVYKLRFSEASFRWAAGEVLSGLRIALLSPARWKTGYAIFRTGTAFVLARLTWPTLLPALKKGFGPPEN